MGPSSSVRLSGHRQVGNGCLPLMVRAQPLAFNAAMDGSHVQTEVFIGSPRKIDVTLSSRGIAFVENNARQLSSRTIPHRNVEADFKAAQLARTLFNDAGLPVDDEALRSFGGVI